MHSLQIQKKFMQAIRSDSSWIVLHSSLMHVTGHENIDVKYLSAFKWELLKMLRMLMNDGYQIAIPAFTFSFTKTGVFDHKTPSEVGVLADWASELLGAKRTQHPIYSHVLLGDEIDAALECSTQTCFGETSIYQFFEEQNATIMMLGCDWSYCTPFHYYEQKFSVPYRYEKQFSAHDNIELYTKMFVRDEKLSVKNDFSNCISSLRAKEQIVSIPFVKGELQAISFNDFSKQCHSDLKSNLLAFVSDQSIVAQQIANNQQATQQTKLTVAVFAESNYQPLLASLENAVQKILPQYRCELSINQYGQMANDILSNTVNHKSIDFCLLPSRLEDLLHLTDIQFSDNVSFIELKPAVESYIGLIKNLSQYVNRLVFVNLFTFSASSLTQDSLTQKSDYSEHPFQIISRLNQLMQDSLADVANVRLLPMASFAMAQYQDERLWYLGRIPYSPTGFDSLANEYIGLLAHECGLSVRLIVLDLDNTLWGGVLGEDGVEGIQIGGDYPGNAFKDFQRTIIALNKRGIALAIASKNDENSTLAAINEHPHMMIKEAHLASYRIDWNEKSANIQSMAKEIGLSISNVMFIDDNPLECEKVRKNCPEVKVIELPKDPVEYRKTLLESPFLKVASTTAEDSKRSQNYVKKRRSQSQAEQFQNLNDYFLSLDIAVNIEEINEKSFNRSIQLTNKTNQFNTTTQRFSDKQLRALLDNDACQAVTVSYSDNVTEQEIIGLMVIRYSQSNISMNCEIDLLLLSCRVLGRSIETAMLVWLEQQCLNKGVESILGKINKTERNTPVREIYSQHGFAMLDENQWLLELKSTDNLSVKLPEWLKLNI